MKSTLKTLHKLSVDEDYPAKNRLMSPDLKAAEIKISFDGGFCLSTSVDLLNDLSKGDLSLGCPITVPGCDIGVGMLAYVYQTMELSLWLSPEALVRLVARRLSSEEYFALRGRYGIFYEIDHDFYDAATGRCLRPVDVNPALAIRQFNLP